VNDIWGNTEPNIRHFADDCITYMKTINNKDMEKLQIHLNRLREWAFKNEMIISPTKS
jgi:hypothetical protein